jgi:hypothetical protein
MLNSMSKKHPARVRGSLIRPSFTACAAATLIVCSSSALAQYENFWERFEFTRDASVSLAYDSNISGTESEADDIILSAQVVGTAAQQFRYARFGVELTGVAAHYFEFDELDYQNIYLNWIIDASETMGGRRLSYSFNFNVRENTDTSEATQGQITVRELNAGGDLAYLMTRYISLGAAVNYAVRDPKGNVQRIVEQDGKLVVDDSQNFVNTTNTTAFSGWLDWQQSEDLSYRLTVNHSIFSGDSNAASDKDFQDGASTGLDASIRGTILPKLTGNLGVGFESRSLDNGVDETSPTLDASLIWQIDDLSSVSLVGTQSFGASINGANTQGTSLSVNYSRRISRQLSMSAGISVNRSEYDFSADRQAANPDLEVRNVKSDSFSIRASVTRVMTERSSLRLAVNMTDYNSDFERGDSNRLRGSLTYSISF